jgi:hypothetical protein
MPYCYTLICVIKIPYVGDKKDIKTPSDSSGGFFFSEKISARQLLQKSISITGTMRYFGCTTGISKISVLADSMKFMVTIRSPGLPRA